MLNYQGEQVQAWLSCAWLALLKYGRVAKGAGAHGECVVTHDITQYVRIRFNKSCSII